MLTVWCCDGMWLSWIIPLLTFYEMKCPSISICLVWSWWIGFFVMLMADWPSLNIFIVWLGFRINSFSNFCIHIPSQILKVNARYSDSTLLRATTVYFLLFQVTRLPRTYEQYPKVYLLSVSSLVQLASMYTSMSHFSIFLREIYIQDTQFYMYLCLGYTNFNIYTHDKKIL